MYLYSLSLILQICVPMSYYKYMYTYFYSYVTFKKYDITRFQLLVIKMCASFC